MIDSIKFYVCATLEEGKGIFKTLVLPSCFTVTYRMDPTQFGGDGG